MKIFIYLLLFSIPFLSCKREKDLPPQATPVIKPDSGYIKSVVVDGAVDVKLDNEKGIIQITLPESYTSDIVNLDLTLHDGASLEINSWNNLYAKNKVGFYFKAAYPETFNIYRVEVSLMSYRVFVEHLGKINAKLSSDLLLFPLPGDVTDYSTVTMRIISGVGTIPEQPDSRKNIIPTLNDQDKNIVIQGSYDVGINSLYFEDTYPLLSSENLSLRLSYGDKEFTFPSGQSISRGPLRAYLDGDGTGSWPVIKHGEASIGGGFFLADKKYQVKLESDFQPRPLPIHAVYKNHHALSTIIPAQLPDGSYLVSIYEEDKMISARTTIVSGDSAVKGIGNVWTRDQQCPITSSGFELSRIRLQRTRNVYINPFPIIYQYANEGFKADKVLPDLELESQTSTVRIKAKPRVDICWGDYSIYLYYGEYAIPAGMATGKYSARLVFAGTGRTIPYFSLFEIY